jgi:hypothetical protein
MNKAIVGVVVVAVVAVGAYFAFMNKPKDGTNEGETQNQQSNTQQQNSESTQQSQNGSLRDLLAQGSRKCSYSFQGDGSVNEPDGTGTIYTANGNAYMDLTAMVNGMSVNSKVLIKDGVYYGWTEGQGMGLKMLMSDADKFNDSSMRQTLDINQKYDYDCENWNPDSAKFVVPANIQFTDLASLNAGN